MDFTKSVSQEAKNKDGTVLRRRQKSEDDVVTSSYYKYEASQPPTMFATASGNGAVTASPPGQQQQGYFVSRRCTMQELEEIPNISELQNWSSEHSLAPSVRDFVNLGAEDDESLEANRRGFVRFALRPRILRNVSAVRTSTTILQGRISLSFPLCVAPFAGCRAVHPDGEMAIAGAAAGAGIVYTIPNWAGTPVANIVETNRKTTTKTKTATSKSPPLFFQVYPHKPRNMLKEGIDRKHFSALLQYLASLGAIAAIIVTLDTTNNSNREKTYKSKQWLENLNDQVGGFPEPCALPRNGILPPVKEQGHSSSMTWEDIHWMRGQCQEHNLALILKGIMTGEDTSRAVQAGVDAIIVSNHGGRQLDGTLGTIEVLAECVQAAKGSSMEIFVDGGVRRGKDIVKCLALGSKCVFVGRPILWGLGAGGQEGVTRALAILREEFQTVLQLLGCANPQQLSPSHVQDRNSEPHHEQSWVYWMVATACITIAAFALGQSTKRS